MRLEAFVLHGQSITLDPVHINGLVEFHEYSVNKELYQFFEFDAFVDIKQSEQYLRTLVDRSKKDSAQYWFITHNKDQKIIGTIGLHTLDSRRSSVEIGYGVSPDYWGGGYFLDAARTAIQYAFADVGVHRMVARTSSENIPSIKGLEKLSFIKEGVMKDYYKRENGDWFDAVLYSRINNE